MRLESTKTLFMEIKQPKYDLNLLSLFSLSDLFTLKALYTSEMEGTSKKSILETHTKVQHMMDTYSDS